MPIHHPDGTSILSASPPRGIDVEAASATSFLRASASSAPGPDPQLAVELVRALNPSMSDSRDADTRPASASREAGARARPRLAALTVAHHRDPSRVGERALVLEQESGRPVLLARHELAFAHPGDASEPRPLAEPRMSRTPIELRASGGGLALDAPASLEVRVDGRAVSGRVALDAATLARGAVIEIGKAALLVAHHAELGARPPRLGITGESAAIDEVRRAIVRVADLAVPVLVEGESGVGKERVARAIHEASGRSGAYVAVNVATLPPSLAASELFGHARGAFTRRVRSARRPLRARRRRGRSSSTRSARSPPTWQAMLLRVLETGEVRRLGTAESRSVDVRVLAATDSDLAAAVDRGDFRGALLHRLRGFVVLVPPLRERREDVPRLALELLREELAGDGRARPPRARGRVAAGLDDAATARASVAG